MLDLHKLKCQFFFHSLSLVSVVLHKSRWESIMYFSLRPKARIFRREGGEGGCIPQEAGPHNSSWNDRPCKFRRHKGFRGVWVHGPKEEFWNLGSSKLLEMHWNCQSNYCHVYLCRFKSFVIPSGRFLWLLGVGGVGGWVGGCTCTLCTSLLMGLYPDMTLNSLKYSSSWQLALVLIYTTWSRLKQVT